MLNLRGSATTFKVLAAWWASGLGGKKTPAVSNIAASDKVQTMDKELGFYSQGFRNTVIPVAAATVPTAGK